MRLDLKRLEESKVGEKVAQLAISGSTPDKVIIKDWDRQKNNLQYEIFFDAIQIVTIGKEGNVHVSNAYCDSLFPYNQAAIQALLQPFDLDDKIEDLGKFLEEEYGFELSNVSFTHKNYQLDQWSIGMNAANTELWVVDCGEANRRFYGMCPTRKSFARQLLNSLGINPKPK